MAGPSFIRGKNFPVAVHHEVSKTAKSRKLSILTKCVF